MNIDEIRRAYRNKCEGASGAINKFEHNPRSMGVQVDKPSSNNGEITFTYDWKKVEKYDKNWD